MEDLIKGELDWHNKVNSNFHEVDSQMADTATLNVKHLPSPLVSLMGDGETDDSVALQNALNYLASIGGGKLFFPKGVYKLARDVQDASNTNAVISLPFIPSVTAKPITIALEGSFMPPTAYPEGNSMPVPTDCSILYTTTSSGNNGSVIGAGKTWNNITFIGKNILFRQPNNPKLSNLDLMHCANVSLENIVTDVDTSITAGIIQPTNTSGISVRLPWESNYGFVRMRNFYCIGYYGGISHGEHADLDNIFIQCTYKAFILYQGHHAARYGKVLAQWCPYVLWMDEAATRTLPLDCSVLDIEDINQSDKWYHSIEHIHDIKNMLLANIKTVRRVIGYVGEQVLPLTINGGKFLKIEDDMNAVNLTMLAQNGIIDSLKATSNTLYYIQGLDGIITINDIDISSLKSGDNIYFCTKSHDFGDYIKIQGNMPNVILPNNKTVKEFLIGIINKNNDEIIHFKKIYDHETGVFRLRAFNASVKSVLSLTLTNDITTVKPIDKQIFYVKMHNVVTINSIDTSNLQIGDIFYFCLASNANDASLTIKASAVLALPGETDFTASLANKNNEMLIGFMLSPDGLRMVY